MQEFSSISVSSYEAGSLADKLTEQSAAGWHVVSIVAAGSDITAYLSRPAGANAIIADTADADPVEAEGSHPIAAETTDSSPAIEPTLPSSSAVDPVDEPAGWAVEPEPASTSPGSSIFEASAEVSAMPESTTESTVGSTSASSTASGAAPAGWYADPSSRFELRYWDGNQWSEHVSRAGQQYTDPPVA